MQHAPPQAKSRKNRGENNFTLVRFALAALVILSHAFQGSTDPLVRLFHTLSFGELAVDAFFVLSGFLVTASWDRSPVPWKFLRKRILRIYPGFIVSFLISVLIIGPIGARDVQSYISHLDSIQLVISAALLKMPTTPHVFSGSVVNQALWTVHLEFACYLLLLGLGFARVLERKWAIILLWASALTAFVTVRYFHGHAGGNGAIYGGLGISMLRFTPLFLAGAVMYKTQLHRHRSSWLILGATALLVLGLSNKITAEAAVGTVGAYLIIIVGSASIIPDMFKKMPDISYGIYLYGWPAEKLVSMTRFGNSALSVFACSLILAIFIGLLSWYIIERPALKLKDPKANARLAPRRAERPRLRPTARRLPAPSAEPPWAPPPVRCWVRQAAMLVREPRSPPPGYGHAYPSGYPYYAYVYLGGYPYYGAYPYLIGTGPFFFGPCFHGSFRHEDFEHGDFDHDDFNHGGFNHGGFNHGASTMGASVTARVAISVTRSCFDHTGSWPAAIE